MKKTLSTIILTFIFLALYAQEKRPDYNILRIVYNGDSTLLKEQYEINLKKEKVFYITPIANYLDVKGEKYKTREKIKSQDWKEINNISNSLFLLTSVLKSVQNDKKTIYSIDFYSSTNKIKWIEFYSEEAPNDLKRLFELIKNGK